MIEVSEFVRSEVVPQFTVPRPVSIVEFCEELCGKPLFPRQQLVLKLIFLEQLTNYEEDVLNRWIQGEDGVVMCPMVRERIAWLRERRYPHFRQVIFNGGRRSSKGHIGGAVFGKKIYDVARLPDPGSHYGIDKDKSIFFTPVATRLDQARDFLFADITSWVQRCRPLVPKVPRFLSERFSVHTVADERLRAELEAMGVDVAGDFAKLVCKPLPASQNAIRGSASMVIGFDEMAHMLATEGRASAEQCYDAAEPALRQFGRDALMLCLSSPYTEIGKFFEEAQKALSMDGAFPMHPDVFYMNFPSWALYAEWWEGTPALRRQQHNMGAIMVNPDWPDEDLNEEERNKKQIAINDERANPEAFAVETRAQWAKVVDAYLSPLVVDRAFAPLQVPEVGFHREFFYNSIGYDYNFMYKGHVDPSSTTAGFGFAIGHVEMLPDPYAPDELCKHVVFDIVKRWNPADFPGHTINWPTVQAEIADFLTFYQPYEFTFDQYQSHAPIQWLNLELRNRGLSGTRVFEVTANSQNNWRRWETTKTAFNLGLVHIPRDCGKPSDIQGWNLDSEQAREELKFLQAKNTGGQYPRVDKQDTGHIRTKDVADCIMEVTAHLIGDYLAERAAGLANRVKLGAEGGYQIGGRQPGGPTPGESPFADFDRARRQQSGYNPARGGKQKFQRRR